MNEQNLFPDYFTPLTPRGHAQARMSGEDALQQGLVFGVIVSSDLIRARQTAKHIAECVGYPLEKIIISPLFRERHYGRLEGTKETPDILIPYYKDESYIDQFDAEPFLEMVERAHLEVAFLKKFDVETGLVVGHGANGRALYRSYRGLPPYERIKDYENAKITDFSQDLRLHL